MMKDPTEFRERFLRWKNGELVYEYGLPKFEGGKDRRKVDWKRWDDAELTSYSVPFVEDKAVRLTNAGVATGAILSTNLLDSIADNAERAGLPLETALGLGVKESTLGNPTDDRSAFRISSGIRSAFGGKYPGTEQHINYWHDALNERDDVINYHKGRQSDDPNSKRKSVLQEAFEFYRQHPDKYNSGLKDYQQMVDKRAKEIMQSPEVRRWKNARDTKKNVRPWTKPYATLKESKFNLPKYEDGYIPAFTDGKMPKYVLAGKDNKWHPITNDEMSAVFLDLVITPKSRGGNTTVGNWKRRWSPKLERGLENVYPEFDLISTVRGIIGILPKKTPTITAKNAAKITPEQWDNAYMSAIANNDIKEVQRLRDLHFKAKAPESKAVGEDGMPIKQYHTVGDAYPADFNEFNPSIEGTHSAIYTSNSPIMSGTYSSKIVSDMEREYYINAAILNMKQQLKSGYVSGIYKKEMEAALKSDAATREYVQNKLPWLKLRTLPERQKALYANIKNPLIVEGGGKHWNNIIIDDLPDNITKNLKSGQTGGFTTRDIESAQKLTGNYDGSIIRNITDYGGSWKSTTAGMKPSDVFQINDPRNLKYADAITYDDAGKIIPLSQRDNFNVADLRYGIIPALIGGSAYYTK